MSSETRVPTEQPTDVVSFKLLIEGSELSATHQVRGVLIEREINRIPYARITIEDHQPAADEPRPADDEAFIPGKTLEIRAGYHGEETALFTGVLLSQRLKVRPAGGPRIVLEAQHDLFATTLEPRSRFFAELTDSDVIDQIASEYGLRTDLAETSVEHPQMLQHGVSDWDFIISRLDANGQVAAVRDGAFTTFEPSLDADPALTLTYGASILELDAELEAREEFASALAVSWSPDDQEIVEVEGTDPELPQQGDVEPGELSEVGGQSRMLRQLGQAREDELEAWANADLLRDRLAKIRGRSRCQGYGEIEPGDVLELKDVSKRFDGKAFVSGVRHEISRGNWTSDIEFGLEPEWFLQRVGLGAAGAAAEPALLPPIGGLYIGVAKGLEDPEGAGRIEVHLPTVHEQGESLWARLATLDAGENRGTVFRPEIDDEVVVGFLADDPRHPVVLGMLHSSAKPPPIEGSDDNHVKGLTTRSEMKVEFDDENKVMTLQTPAGNKIALDEQNGGIFLEDENGNTITLDSSGITLDTPKDITLKAASNITIEASANLEATAGARFTAEGSAGAEVTTGATAVLKGALVQIN